MFKKRYSDISYDNSKKPAFIHCKMIKAVNFIATSLLLLKKLLSLYHIIPPLAVDWFECIDIMVAHNMINSELLVLKILLNGLQDLIVFNGQ